MSLPHFFAGAPEPGSRVELSPEDARHAVASLRLGVGDRLTSGDGEGGLAVCRVVEVDRQALVAEVESVERSEPEAPQLSVVVAAPKGDRLTWALQKLTEVGTDRVVLVEAARSVRRWSGDRAKRIRARAEAVAREAAKQSRRRFLPEVEGPTGWAEAIGEAAARGPVVLLWEEARTGLASVLPEDAPPSLTLVVGPEGGITEEEARDAESRGALLGALGATVLRTETAALAAASIVLARYGRLGDRP